MRKTGTAPLMGYLLPSGVMESGQGGGDIHKLSYLPQVRFYLNTAAYSQILLVHLEVRH